MKCHVFWTSLFLLVRGLPVIPGAVSGRGSFASQLGQEVGDLVAPCLGRVNNASGPWACLKEESLAAVERLSLAPRITLLDGVSLVRAGINGSVVAEDLRYKTGLTWPYSVLEALRRLLQSHILEVDLALGTPKPPQLLTVRFVGQNMPADIDRTEGRHRRRQQMIPMMIFGVTVFGMFIVPIAFQFLTALSGKAFLMAKLALLLASINGLKRVASTGVHYGLYHAVDQPYSAGPHHPPPPLHHPFGAGPMLYERTDGLGYAEGPRTDDGNAFVGAQSAPFFTRMKNRLFK